MTLLLFLVIYLRYIYPVKKSVWLFLGFCAIYAMCRLIDVGFEASKWPGLLHYLGKT